MNEAYTTDFIARCMAAEALEKAESGSSDVADVDASVSNSQLTIQLEDSNGSPVGSGATVNLPSGLPPSTSSDEGKVLTVNSSGNAEWDESEVNVFRTEYVDKTNDITVTTMEGMTAYRIPVPENFTALQVSFNFSGTATSGEWNLSFNQYDYSFMVGPDNTRERSGLIITMIEGHTKGDNPDLRWQGDMSSIRYYAEYDSVNNTVAIALSTPFLSLADETSIQDNSTNAAWTSFTMNRLGYIAYGNSPVVYDGLTAGTGIDITNDVISLDINYGASFELSINSSTYVLTATLKDQNGNTLGQPQTVDLPLETMVVSGSYDDTTKKIVLTLQNGQTVEFSVADLVDGLETSAHAASTYQTIAGMSAYETTSHASSTYQTIAGMSNYATQTDIADMATETWVGNQGYLTSADEVPDVTSSDDGKILKATYSGGTGSYAWETPQTFTQEQANWTESDNTKVSYIKNKPNLATVATSGSYNDLSNKPTIPAAQVNSDWNASSGVAQILNKPDLSTYATQNDISDMATETWVGQQGYLTSADEVPTVGSSDDGKILTASYSGGTGSYSWETAPSGLPASTSADENKVLTVDSNGDAAWEFIPDKSGIYGHIMYADDSDTFTESLFSLQNPLDTDMDGSGNTQATDGDVLTWDSTDQIMKWQAPSSGGLQVETDGTNYWITVNSIRLYFASSEPSAPAGGSIPDGSIGIGW